MHMDNDTPDLFDQAAPAQADAAPPAPPAEPPAPGFADGMGDGTSLPLAAYAERAYLSYAMSVVRARALPQVEDGLKPVQRRILHAMNEMRLAASAKHVKSARVVGDVIGKYHPHGDTSVYDAMVRVAQDFTLRYPLVDGQGNFGSRDGDGAAAMRYTECRLTPFADLLLGEIDRGTVDFTANYDGSMTEPQLMPARLPVVLLNGASGIAVGMATEIPPHNLREVAEAARLLIKKPEAVLEEVLAVLPGPDFPGGGQLISTPADIRDAYANGRGSPAHARPLAHRRTCPRPVAGHRLRTAARCVRGAGAVGNRRPHQSATARRQEGRQPGAEEPQGAGARRARRRARRVQRPAGGAHHARTQELAHSRRTNSWPCCWRTPASSPASRST
jgi:topoisomerase-4 subunit A